MTLEPHSGPDIGNFEGLGVFQIVLKALLDSVQLGIPFTALRRLALGILINKSFRVEVVLQVPDQHLFVLT